MSLDQFVDLLRRSKLVEPERLDPLLDAWREQHGAEAADSETAQSETADSGAAESGAAESEAFITLLIERRVITRWQADKLRGGRFRGFFLGRYKLLEQIGAGGMSRVFLAEHTLLHQRRALKVLPRERVGDSTYLARFQLEAQAIASLDHPNIVRAYDIDEASGMHYLVMEYVQGRDLLTLVEQQGPLDYATAADYILQAARGLQHAHDLGLIHRDVKPANLLIDEDGVVKVLDLGLALFREREEHSLTIAHQENVLGTADYLAPEQALNSHSIDGRADIYALGCTLYFALTGAPPFPEGSIAQRIARHQSMEPPPLRDHRPDCPADLEAICVDMMRKRPAERYQTARDVERALEQYLRGQQVTVRAPQVAAPVSVTRGDASPSRGASRQPVGGEPARPMPDLMPRRVSAPPPEDTVSERVADTHKGLPVPASRRSTASRKRTRRRSSRWRWWLGSALVLLLLIIIALAAFWMM